jgi:hypothetical protein
MIINTMNKSYAPKWKYDPPRTSSTPASSSQGTNVQTVKIPKIQEVPSPLPSSKYNILNQLDKIYSPSNKLMKHYTQAIWMLISNLLSFNITHVKRELNSMVDRLVVFVTSPT